MSSVAVRAALETALAAITPALDTAWENTTLTPVVDVPYQRVKMVFADPENAEIGATFLERGYMQVDLLYPLGAGAGPAQARVELLRAAFYRGRTLTASGQSVLIERTPSILPGFEDVGRYCVPVRIPFRS